MEVVISDCVQSQNVSLRKDGEEGIRTLGARNAGHNGLASRRIKPLCHLSEIARILSYPFAYIKYQVEGKTAGDEGAIRE